MQLPEMTKQSLDLTAGNFSLLRLDYENIPAVSDHWRREFAVGNISSSPVWKCPLLDFDFRLRTQLSKQG